MHSLKGENPRVDQGTGEKTVRKDRNQLLGTRNWRLMAERRKDWGTKLQEATTRFGL